ncbi:MAG TPA: patatin-like phospholipase family protein [Nitrospiraceae bacterium]|nr:patatin-like phospholipase family protein [Nitrospiraceae bacterium]
MAESVIEPHCHHEEYVATRKRFFITVDVPHGLAAWVTGGMVLAVLSGCVTSPVYIIPVPKPDQTSCSHAMKPGDTLIGIAISGGGSRAALFGAASLEALAKLQVGPPAHSLLEDVSVISSVSGGSMATSYFAAVKPRKDVPMLTPSGELSAEYQTFFAQYKETMNQDYEKPLLWHNLLRLRWFNPAWAAKSLAEYLNSQFLHDMTFQHVRERELSGEIPRLLINTTLYNDGRRLVFTTVPHEQTQYDLLKDVSRSVGASHLSEESIEVMQVKWASLQSVTPQALNLDLCPIRFGGAVAASMSFPPVVGPITFKVEGEDQYWHAGDGGLSDNMGLESLATVTLHALQQKTVRRALIIAFDSSFPFAVGSDRLNHFPEGFSLFNYDYGRIPGIMEERALAYRTLYFRTMTAQGVLPDERRLKFLQLRHIDAVWKEDMSDLPKSCENEEVKLTNPPMVKKRLASVVTRLWLKSACDRDLVATAAAKLVEGEKDEILKFLQQSPP